MSVYIDPKSSHNYARSLIQFVPRYPELYDYIGSAGTFTDTRNKLFDISNRNSLSSIKWYIPRLDILLEKHHLSIFLNRYFPDLYIKTIIIPKGSRVPLNKLKKNGVYLAKPSTLFIGGGNHIQIALGYSLGGRVLSHKIPFIIQPRLDNVVTWERRKWDIRHFAILIRTPMHGYAAYVGKRGYARIASEIYNPLELEAGSNLTSGVISSRLHPELQEHDVSQEISRGLSKYLGTIASEILKKWMTVSTGDVDTSFYGSFVLLGFDSILTSTTSSTEFKPSSPSIVKMIKNGRLRHHLIEINQEPSNHLSSEFPMRNSIMEEIWTDIVLKIFPWILNDDGAPSPKTQFLEQVFV